MFLKCPCWSRIWRMRKGQHANSWGNVPESSRKCTSSKLAPWLRSSGNQRAPVQLRWCSTFPHTRIWEGEQESSNTGLCQCNKEVGLDMSLNETSAWVHIFPIIHTVKYWPFGALCDCVFAYVAPCQESHPFSCNRSHFVTQFICHFLCEAFLGYPRLT